MENVIHPLSLSNVFKRLTLLLKTQGVIKTLQHARIVLLHRLHEHFVITESAQLEKIATGGDEKLSTLDIPRGKWDKEDRYIPTPYFLIQLVYDFLPAHLQPWCFVDIGCGRGRVLIEAAKHPFKKIIGIDFAKEHQRDTTLNLKALPATSIKAKDWDVLHGDALQMPLPTDPAIYFLFNTFEDDILEPFLARIQAQKTPEQPLIFAYVNPCFEGVFQAADWLQKIPLPITTRLKLSLFSPFNVVFYANTQGAQSLAK